MKKFIPLLAIVALCACTSPAPSGSSSSSASSSMPQTTDRTYVNQDLGYQIQYPNALAVQPDTVLNLPNGEVTGTAFVFPKGYESGTTLSEAQVHVSAGASCPAATADSTGFNGMLFGVNAQTDAGAGNLYENKTYFILYEKRCYMLTLFIHSCNLGTDCGPGHDKPYDKQPLSAVFDHMASTFRFLP